MPSVTRYFQRRVPVQVHAANDEGSSVPSYETFTTGMSITAEGPPEFIAACEENEFLIPPSPPYYVKGSRHHIRGVPSAEDKR